MSMLLKAFTLAKLVRHRVHNKPPSNTRRSDLDSCMGLKKRKILCGCVTQSDHKFTHHLKQLYPQARLLTLRDKRGATKSVQVLIISFRRTQTARFSPEIFSEVSYWRTESDRNNEQPSITLRTIPGLRETGDVFSSKYERNLFLQNDNAR